MRRFDDDLRTYLGNINGLKYLIRFLDQYFTVPHTRDNIFTRRVYFHSNIIRYHLKISTIFRLDQEVQISDDTEQTVAEGKIFL